MVALRNHGNSANGTNSSSSPSNSQKPLRETLDTSTAEVCFPSGADDICIGLDVALGNPKLLFSKTIILRQRNRWLKPKLGFPVGALHVDVHSGLFAGEKVKPKWPDAKNSGTHGVIVPRF
jgi:hypothetical protein